MKVSELGEFGLIEHLCARLLVNVAGRPGVLQSIGDDAAVLSPLSAPVVTCDALVEGVHFRRDWTTPFLLGRKAMAVNVSDIAASGAFPVAAFVSLGLSTPFAEEAHSLAWLDALYDGFQSAADEFGFTLAGGDTTRTANQIMISITLIGEVEAKCRQAGAPILRAGGRAGDALLVTGTLGDAAAGWFLLEHPQIKVSTAAREFLMARHFNPQPRVREMRAALFAAGSTPGDMNDSDMNDGDGVRAALDLSDGLAGDAAHIAARSQIQLQIDTAKLPISPQCREAANAARAAGFAVSAKKWALSGGEDYELLLCVAPESSDEVARAIQSQTGTVATVIGRCLPKSSSPVALLGEDGETESVPPAWTHF